MNSNIIMYWVLPGVVLEMADICNGYHAGDKNLLPLLSWREGIIGFDSTLGSFIKHKTWTPLCLWLILV